MNKKIGTTVIMAFLIVLSTFAGMSLANMGSGVLEATEINNNNGNSTGMITITGSEKIEASPDQVVIYLKAQSLNPDSVQKARDKVARIINDVITSLTNLGIDEDQIETSNYNIRKEYKWINHSRVFQGYKVVSDMEVTVKDFDKAGEAIDKCVDANAFVKSIEFELSKEKRQDLKLQALAKAAENAKEKAETIVSALDEKLGKVKTVDSQYHYNYYPIYRAKSLSYTDASEVNTPPTDIKPKDLTVSADLQVVFEII